MIPFLCVISILLYLTSGRIQDPAESGDRGEEFGL